MDRNQAKIANGVNILAGIWLILSPFILGFSGIAEAAWNSIIVGAAVLILAAVDEWGATEETRWVDWANVALGIWLIASPFILGFGFDMAALWNSVIIGIVVAAAAAWGGAVHYVPREQP